VPKYSARKHGEVTIYTPAELQTILKAATGWQRAFIAIAAFSALRASEIHRLDWSRIELSDQAGESFIEVRSIENTKSDGRRRLVPVSDNLKAWLRPWQQTSGPIPATHPVDARLLKKSLKGSFMRIHRQIVPRQRSGIFEKIPGHPVLFAAAGAILDHFPCSGKWAPRGKTRTNRSPNSNHPPHGKCWGWDKTKEIGLARRNPVYSEASARQPTG